MSEKAVAAVKSIVAAGFQLDKECLELLRLMQDKVDLEQLVGEVVKKAAADKLWPPVINKSLLEKAALKVSPEGNLATEDLQSTVVAAQIPFAKEVESQIVVLDDERARVRSKAAMEDFTRYFRTRFRKIHDILNERLDARGAGTVGQALRASLNEKVRFIAMIMDKRHRQDHIFLNVEDEENTAVVMVQRGAVEAFEAAQSIPLDQVVYIEAVRGRSDLFVCERIYLPDIPDHKPQRADEPVYAALLSDTHVGSRFFLREVFAKMILWLNGKAGTPNQRDIAGRIKYVIIAGDLVDGVGIYPGQERELEVTDVYAQYKLAAQYIEQIPDYVDVIYIPGNHDATRQALPQSPVPKEFAEPVYAARDVKALGNPTRLQLHNVRFLIYHGRSLDDVVATVPGMTFQTPDKAMEHLLRCRHLAPEYGQRTPIAPEQEDQLVIRDVPDVFHCGHVHVQKHKEYRGTVVVNSGAWQNQTDYQRRLGLVPTPGRLPILNLQTLQVGVIDFTSPQ